MFLRLIHPHKVPQIQTQMIKLSQLLNLDIQQFLTIVLTDIFRIDKKSIQFWQLSTLFPVLRILGAVWNVDLDLEIDQLDGLGKVFLVGLLMFGYKVRDYGFLCIWGDLKGLLEVWMFIWRGCWSNWLHEVVFVVLQFDRWGKDWFLGLKLYFLTEISSWGFSFLKLYD